MNVPNNKPNEGKIKEVTDIYRAKLAQGGKYAKHHEACLNVLEKNMDEEEITDKYYDEDNPWIEQDASKVAQWMNGELEEDELPNL